MQRLNAYQRSCVIDAIVQEQRRLGHSQREVASLTGVPQDRISKILKGDFRTLNPSVSRLCKYANISVELLLSRVDVEPAIQSLARQIVETWNGSAEDRKFVAELLTTVREMVLANRKRSAGR